MTTNSVSKQKISHSFDFPMNNKKRGKSKRIEHFLQQNKSLIIEVNDH